MLKNHLKIAFRTLKNHKSYTTINVLGLAMGIACSLIIFLLVKYHLSFDTYHTKSDRIYRLVTELHFDENIYTPGTPHPIKKAIQTDYPSLENITLTNALHNVLISVPANRKQVTRKFQEEESVTFAEPEFFEVFDYKWLKGNSKTALATPHTAVITRKYANKYFGNQAALGKLIRLDNKTDFTITGIIEDIPANTDRKHEVFFSYATYKTYTGALDKDMENWGSISSNTQCFIVLPANYSASQFERQMPAFRKKYLDKEDVNIYWFLLQPLKDIHFNSDYDGYIQKSMIWSLALVGIFLIATACINFVNLATAQALKRSKEVGVRKVVGSTRLQLFSQFIIETGLITLLAVVLAIGLTKVALPYINEWFEAKLALDLLHDTQLILFLPLLTGLVVALAGFYPAFVLSGFKPALALKGKIGNQHIGGLSLRRALVVLQFSISQALIIGTIVVTAQMNFSKKTDLGFNSNAIVTMPVPVNDPNKMQTMRNRLLQVPGVEKVSLNYSSPAADDNNTTSFRFDTRTKDEVYQINTKAADAHYVETFDLKLVAGRNLILSDTIREYLVNETLIRKLKLKSPEEAIGRNMHVNGITAPIVGVVKDFHLESFHAQIDPCVIMSFARVYENCAVKINLQQVPTTIQSLEKIWNETYPDNVFEYQFLDERIAKFYELEETMLQLIKSFSFIAIFIGCLGLYGLVSFMAAQKTKEVGIRKVLGASVSNIVWLFAREFIRLIIIAFLIAAPIAWYFMDSWLQDFVYRINIGVAVFAVAISISLLIALLTVSYRAIRAALANPIRSLRSE